MAVLTRSFMRMGAVKCPWRPLVLFCVRKIQHWDGGRGRVQFVATILTAQNCSSVILLLVSNMDSSQCSSDLSSDDTVALRIEEKFDGPQREDEKSQLPSVDSETNPRPTKRRLAHRSKKVILASRRCSLAARNLHPDLVKSTSRSILKSRFKRTPLKKLAKTLSKHVAPALVNRKRIRSPKDVPKAMEPKAKT
ncbi:hypothetical protein TSAR_004437 [Trichomalopsis sarcophagae]|uniref:Uncharacterized protein n=1 Tax=Trichomalopsis sarcophagae TaxID=543379 RepID=A0A232EKR2_9HYME|nr:hypothetical protein TSAR_004437 [Trichomalopsis sarcophagae]